MDKSSAGTIKHNLSSHKISVTTKSMTSAGAKKLNPSIQSAVAKMKQKLKASPEAKKDMHLNGINHQLGLDSIILINFRLLRRIVKMLMFTILLQRIQMN